MFRKILRTVLTGMSKVQEIPSALHVLKAVLDPSWNVVATSSTDVEGMLSSLCQISRQMNPTLRIYQSSSSNQMQISHQSRFLNPSKSGIFPLQLPHSYRSFKKAS
ncbi:hypothetical protein AVEN_153513-1 [Araneus ventricosus]|uniref:Uncharacterized protein n=1 Tax=Araneus ventricosus TaxID=182803 RepID=A0A4Y2XCW8_ARAVE|nr:hypothetical protein AVEN_153513-1 [Araneus ventricosus]